MLRIARAAQGVRIPGHAHGLLRAKSGDSDAPPPARPPTQPHPGEPRQDYGAVVQRVRSLLQVPALISTGQPFSTGIDAFLPAWSSLDLHDDVTFHEPPLSRPSATLSPRRGVRAGRKLPEGFSRPALLNQCQPRAARQRLGVRWVRGEGTHRFPLDPPQTIQSGVSPVPRQPPHSKTSRQFGRFRGRGAS